MDTVHVLLLQTSHLHWSAMETALQDFPEVRVTVERPQVADIVGLCERYEPDFVVAAVAIDQESTLPALAEVRRRHGTEVRFVVIDWTLADHNRVRDALSLDPVGYFVWPELDAFSLRDYLQPILAGAAVIGPNAWRMRGSLATVAFDFDDQPLRMTVRQREALRMLAVGLTRKELASQLGVSQETVKREIRALREAIDARTEEELMYRVGRSGFALNGDQISVRAGGSLTDYGHN